MNKIKPIAYIALVLTLSAGFMACSQALGPEEGSITLQLPGSAGGRAFTEAEKNSFTYRVTFTGPGNRVVNISASAGKTVTAGALAAGRWTVEVRALNDDNVPVAYGSDTVTVASGNSRAVVTMGEVIFNMSQLLTAIAGAEDGDTLVIGDDIEITVPVEILKHISLSSTGNHSLYRGSSNQKEFFTVNGKSLTLSAEGRNSLTLDGKNQTADSPLIVVNTGAALILSTGAVLQNNVINTSGGLPGGAVYSKDGDVTVSGGVIRYNKDVVTGSGGGMYLVRSNFTMTGGAVYSNTAVAGGGAGNGGGISIDNLGLSGLDAARTVTISGGSVYGNTAGTDGGGIYIFNSYRAVDTVVFSGGSVYGNIAKTGSGGGINSVNSADFTMTGGAVYQNKGKTGAGVSFSVGSLAMTGGHICGNILIGGGTQGGGLYIDTSTISGLGAKNAEIKGNSPPNVHKDVSVSGSLAGIAVGGEGGENDICSMGY
ncbi:hypothetical protein [Breznakiella homolactica]|uniref:Uncharacterized protein n=1 Tax=Breznakiella homolactica TaxID=2798577 RepID=A0A7T8BB82_9SPIR|nr:hypothetical protein [Breznakiella homolactica]QQO10277.1 hypothetical protein JFL75_04980 [Breznakiella homolactica]